MFDALSSLFEGKNINRRMTLRNQLKGVKIQKEVKSYFTSVSQIKDQFQVIGDMVEEAEFVMTPLNGLLREWESGYFLRILKLYLSIVF